MSISGSLSGHAIISEDSTVQKSTPLHNASNRHPIDRLLFESKHNNGGGDHKRSLEFRLWQGLVLFIRMITPFSYVYLACLVIYTIFLTSKGYNWLAHPRLSWMALFTFWMIAEALFFPYYCYLFDKLHKLNHTLNHVASNKLERQKFVNDCFESLKHAAPRGEEPYIYIRKSMEGYFFDCPVQQILRDNFRLWMSWSFFGKEFTELTKEERVEIEDYIVYVEKEIQWTFLPGFNKDVKAVRLTLDPVFATQRPFAYYAAIMAYNFIAHVAVYILGFRKRQEFSAKDQSIYYRPAKISKSASPKKSSSSSKLPVVFIHGIGIGFGHYITILLFLPTEVDVYLVEWPYVSMQLSIDIPTNEQVVESIVNVLDKDCHEHACFVGHSLGTTAISWMLHHPKGIEKVASSLQLDPITFLLNDPAVAINFVYKEPVTTLDFMMHFFVSRELFIANSLSRHFSWSQNIEFTEDLERASRLRTQRSKKHSSNESLSNRIDHTIVISTKDSIIPVQPLLRYFESKLSIASSLPEGSCFQYMSLEGLSHGEMFLYPKHVRFVASKIRQMCGLEIMTDENLLRPHRD